MTDFSRLKPALVLQRMPRNGHNSSEAVNDFIEQTIHDVGDIYNFVNGVIIPAFNGFGKTGTYSDVDPVVNGIHGSTILTNRLWADSTCPYMYDSAKARPKTIEETALQIISDLDRLFQGLNEVRGRLGTTSTEAGTPTSQSTLTELETKVNYLNTLTQGIRNSVAGFLSASGIATAISDNTINPTSYNIVDTDVSGSAAINPVKISGVDLTAAMSPAYSAGLGGSYDTKDSILRLRDWIADLTGETFTSYTGTNKTSTGTYTTLKAHVAASGSAVTGPTATNPHGLDVSNLSDGNGLLSRYQFIAGFDVRPSGNSGNTSPSGFMGGYEYVPQNMIASKVTMTLGISGSSNPGNLTVHVKRVRSGYSDTNLLSSPITLAIVAGVPAGTSSTAFADAILLADDLLYVSGHGYGSNARVAVWGKP